MNEQRNDGGQAGACEVLSESDHMDVDVQAENIGWQTNLHGTQEDVQRNEFMHVSVLVYVSDL